MLTAIGICFLLCGGWRIALILIGAEITLFSFVAGVLNVFSLLNGFNTYSDNPLLNVIGSIVTPVLMLAVGAVLLIFGISSMAGRR